MKTTCRIGLHLLTLILLAAVPLSACRPTTPAPIPTPSPTAQPAPPAAPTPPPQDVIYLAIIRHQPQPAFYLHPETGVYSNPYVRVPPRQG